MLTPTGAAQSSRPRRAVVAVIALAAFGGWAADARAQCTPDDQSAECQYVEDIPQSGGSQPSGGSGDGGGAGSGSSPGVEPPLSPAVLAKIEASGGRDARLLEQIATSEAYGAPKEPARLGSAQIPATDKLQRGSALSAAASAVGSGETALVVLLAGLIAVSVAALAVATRRQI